MDKMIVSHIKDVVITNEFLRKFDIAINNKFNSYPPTKPLDNVTVSIAPII